MDTRSFSRTLIRACKAYMKAGYWMTTRQIMTQPLPKDATSQMRKYRQKLRKIKRSRRLP